MDFLKIKKFRIWNYYLIMISSTIKPKRGVLALQEKIRSIFGGFNSFSQLKTLVCENNPFLVLKASAGP